MYNSSKENDNINKLLIFGYNNSFKYLYLNNLILQQIELYLSYLYNVQFNLQNTELDWYY